MANLTKLEGYLATRSYLEGYAPSQADVSVYKAITSPPTTTNVLRWYNHIKSYKPEFETLPGSSDGANAFLGGGDAPAAEDDEIDLFGDDDEEEDAEAEKLKAERLAAYAAKKATKPKTTAKSVVTFEVKPWDDETDMVALEAAVRGIEMDGLVWGASKLVAVGYGIKKLQITIVIEDEKISLDDLQEKVAEFDDYVQSSDIAAMQKL